MKQECGPRHTHPSVQGPQKSLFDSIYRTWNSIQCSSVSPYFPHDPPNLWDFIPVKSSLPTLQHLKQSPRHPTIYLKQNKHKRPHTSSHWVMKQQVLNKSPLVSHAHHQSAIKKLHFQTVLKPIINAKSTTKLVHIKLTHYWRENFSTFSFDILICSIITWKSLKIP